MKNNNRLQTFTLASMIAALLLFSAAAFPQALPAPKEEKLLNGLKILMWTDARSDKVTVRIRIHSGSAFDPQGKEGTMQLLADDLFPNDASREFFAEDLGGSLEVVTTYDYIQINATSKPESLLTMLETLSTAISNPAIDKETTARIRTALLAKLKGLEVDPAYVADQAVAKRLFGTFPYGRPRLGSTASVQKLDFADLIDAKQRFLTADNATMTINGNFDRDLAYKALRRYFGSWLKSDKRVPSTFRQPDEPDTKELRIDMPNLPKYYSRSARSAPGRNEKGFYPMRIFTAVLLAQRCPEVGRYQVNLLRGIYVTEEDGEYTLHNTAYSGPCRFSVEKKEGAIVVSGISQDDLERARTNVASEIHTQTISPEGLANLWLDVDTYKLVSVDDEIKKATAVNVADVQLVAQKLFNSPVVRVMVADPAKSNR